jgi:hypothetical protein
MQYSAAPDRLKNVRPLFCLIVLLLCCEATRGETQRNPLTFYVQFIQANNMETPKEAHWKPIGARLRRQISPVFRWRNYWETTRHTISLEKGRIAKVLLNSDREVHLEWVTADRVAVRLYRVRKLVRRSYNSGPQQMIIMGGDDKQGEGWFVVVRRDKPQ